MKKIRTNHIKVVFYWDEFLEDFDLYKIEYSDAYDFDNNLGIYCKLEGLCPNSAVSAFNKMVRDGNADDPTKHRIFLFASDKKDGISTAILQERLEKVNVKIKRISSNPGFREGIYPHNMLNLMLSMMPNRDRTLSYAHGKLICGTCSSLYNKGKKQGEELGLQLEFAYGGLLQAHSFERLEYMQDTFLGLVNVEQNKIIKIFTVVSVIFLPPTLVASMYGMNFDFMPELHWRFGYLWAIGLMIAFVIIILWYFKRRKWI